MSSRLTISRAGHAYAVDGQRVPSATTIIGNATNKRALVTSAAKLAAQWAATHTDLISSLGEGEWIKQAATAHHREWGKKADRGTDAHTLAQRAISGEVDVPPELVGLVSQAVSFMDTWRLDEIAAERPCYSVQWRYGGRFDVLATLADGCTWMLDWKTGSGPYVEQALQLVAYATADYYQDANGDDVPMPEIDKLGFVMLTDDEWALVPVSRWNPPSDPDDRARLTTVFRSMIPVSNYVELATPDYRTGRAVWPVLGEPLPRSAAVGS